MNMRSMILFATLSFKIALLRVLSTSNVHPKSVNKELKSEIERVKKILVFNIFKPFMKDMKNGFPDKRVKKE